MCKLKNKKSLVLIFLFSILLIGVTVAYFFNRTTYENEFDLSNFDTVTTEVFTSPDNWQPGDTTEKTVAVTNNGTVDVAVRACLKERWYNESGAAQGREKKVSFEPDADVIIDEDNTNDWIKEDNCFYYKNALKPGLTTPSFMKSVTLNPNLGDDLDCELNNNVETCVSYTNVNGGSYKLYITTETVQYSMYKSAWKTDIVISPSSSNG